LFISIILQTKTSFVRFEVFTAVTEEFRFLGYGAVYISCEQTFRRNVSPPSSGKKNPRARNQREQVASVWFLAHGFLYPEVRGYTFPRNVISHRIYMSPHPRRRQPSKTIFAYNVDRICCHVVIV
jgi:hypothetical protein